jgi:hypothetical protein
MRVLEGSVTIQEPQESQDDIPTLELVEIVPLAPDVFLDIEGDALWIDVNDEWIIPDEVRLALADMAVQMVTRGDSVLVVENEIRRRLKSAVSVGTIKRADR